jgi:phage shock protein PspC (stress-responsive transcriptional regulator)
MQTLFYILGGVFLLTGVALVSSYFIFIWIIEENEKD